MIPSLEQVQAYREGYREINREFAVELERMFATVERQLMTEPQPDEFAQDDFNDIGREVFLHHLTYFANKHLDAELANQEVKKMLRGGK